MSRGRSGSATKARCTGCGRLADELGQREILQAGIELIEAPTPDGDAEVLAVAAAALAAAQLPETRLDVGHVAPVRCVLGAAPR